MYSMYRADEVQVRYNQVATRSPRMILMLRSMLIEIIAVDINTLFLIVLISTP